MNYIVPGADPEEAFKILTEVRDSAIGKVVFVFNKMILFHFS